MKTRPWIPRSFSARSRPPLASALNPRSFRPPMSVTSATLTSEPLLPLSPLPPQPAASAARTTIAAQATRRRGRGIPALYPGLGLRKRSMGGHEARPSIEPLLLVALLDGARRLDLAGGEVLLPLAEHVDQRGAARRGRRDLADADAAVLGAIDAVDAALPLRRACELDGVEHTDVDPLQGARQDVLAEVELIGVHADPPVLGVLRGLERPESACAGDLEDHVGVLLDLVEGDLLALRLVDEVLRVVVERLGARLVLLRTVLVPGDVMVDRRDLQSADRADHAALGRPRRSDTGETARVLLREQDAARVLRLPLETRGREVDDRELLVGEPLRHCCHLVGHQEPDADHEVVLPRAGREVRDVVGRALRDEDAPVDAELLLRVLETLVRESVEALVVEAPDVCHERDAELGGRSRLGRPDRGDGQRRDRDERDRGEDHPFANRHVRTLLDDALTKPPASVTRDSTRSWTGVATGAA